jgi:hypothetical protein
MFKETMDIKLNISDEIIIEQITLNHAQELFNLIELNRNHLRE